MKRTVSGPGVVAALAAALVLTRCSALPPAAASAATATVGSAEAPVVAEALGLNLRTGQADELEHGLLRTLTDRHATEQGLGVTADEVRTCRESQRRFVATHGVDQPVDAYRRFLQDQQSRGRFRILDPSMASAFWRLQMSNNRSEFFAVGSAAERLAAQALIAAASPSNSTGSSR